MAVPFTPELLELIDVNQVNGHRPLLFANARILTGDSLIGDFDRGDVLLGGDRVVGIGPGLLSAADDDGAIVIDCDGYAIVPAVIDTASINGLRSPGHRAATAVAPGNPAAFAIVPAEAADSNDTIVRRFLRSPESAQGVVLDGRIALWAGRALAAAPAEAGGGTSVRPSTDERLGTWVDENGFVHQSLTADGRYDETRGGREHAFHGNFWITGDRIDYRDDLGFWAFGEFTGDSLRHAGYTFHRS
ncbi:Atu4866 domain-containing protein [Kineococcus sp. GCM10028916]|uniref:Atu4866 domain-containing protein n=1 Tax=Kineococcus sp. GCM10028916 TaxID=3273394 RepID=UPI00362F32DD